MADRRGRSRADAAGVDLRPPPLRYDARVRRPRLLLAVWISASLVLASVASAAPGARAAPRVVDLVVRQGAVHDGRGGAPFVGDVAVDGGAVVAVAARVDARGRQEIDARGLAVAPGFVNVLSHAFPILYEDGRAESDLRQGVTLQIFGETSWGPLSERQKRALVDSQSAGTKFPVAWTTLGEFLAWLERRGTSANFASFVSAGTVRQHVVGAVDRRATPAELARMAALVDEAMREGALGLSTALIYPPASYADTDELVALARRAAAHGGLYAAHLRDEGDRLVEALREHVGIARAAKLPAHVYHFKAAGSRNWPSFADAIGAIEAARAEGLRITADVYTYTAGATGLTAWLPAWLQDGGTVKALARMRDPADRARVVREMQAKPGGAGALPASPDQIRFTAFRAPALQPLVGKTLAEVARARGSSPEETAMDLIVEDGTRVSSIFFLMSEENVRRAVALPWVTFGSDAPAYAARPPFTQASPHPRAYGTFARLLGKYVRDEKAVPLEEAIRRLTSFPAETFGVARRGRLAPGYFADVVVFDPATIADHATYDRPHQYATGVRHVLVNGVPVIRDGAHTGAKPGRAVWGPGRRGAAPPRRRAATR